MTSSLRNSIHRRNHKERSQLAHRSKFGILEKHADYVKRARDYHSKQDRLNRLKQKVAERNKDEFYFSMGNEKTKGGVHIKDRGNVALPTDIVKVLKTQDENYVRTMRAAGLKKIDKIKNRLMALADLVKPGMFDRLHEEKEDELDEEELHILSEAGIIAPRKNGRQQPKHIIFVDSQDKAQQYSRPQASRQERTDMTTELPTNKVDLGWKTSDGKKKLKRRLTLANEEEDQAATADDPRQLAVLNRSRLLKELSARLSRDKQLRYAEREFEMQRLLMGKGGRKKLRGVEKPEGHNRDDEENEDEVDARKGKRRALVTKVNEETYRPRVYKWRLERKR